MADVLVAATEHLFNSPLQTWVSHDDSPNNFNARLARQSSFPTDCAEDIDLSRYIALEVRSQQTSINVHPLSDNDLDSMASDNVPGLTRGNSVASTYSATNTDMASVIDGGFVLESEDGVLTIPARFQRNADLLCPFQVLDCHEAFSDIVDFKIHVFSHFRGHPLPPYAPCFVCGHPFFQRPEDDNALAWNNLLSHMTYDHYRSGETALRIRPDIAVMRYMWNRLIITEAEFKRIQLEASLTHLPRANDEQNEIADIPEAPMAPPAPVPTEIMREHFNQSVGLQSEPFTVSAGRRQERRQADRLRLIARVRGNL